MDNRLTEVDLCTSLPSGVPESGRLPCSVTRLRLLGVQDSTVRRWDPRRIRLRGSSKKPGYLGILTDLHPVKQPEHTFLVPLRLLVYIRETWEDP